MMTCKQPNVVEIADLVVHDFEGAEANEHLAQPYLNGEPIIALHVLAGVQAGVESRLATTDEERADQAADRDYLGACAVYAMSDYDTYTHIKGKKITRHVA